MLLILILALVACGGTTLTTRSEATAELQDLSVVFEIMESVEHMEFWVRAMGPATQL